MRQVLKVDNDKLVNAFKLAEVVQALSIMANAELAGLANRRYAQRCVLQSCVAL